MQVMMDERVYESSVPQRSEQMFEWQLEATRQIKANPLRSRVGRIRAFGSALVLLSLTSKLADGPCVPIGPVLFAQ